MNCIPMLLNITSSWFWPWTKTSSVASNDWLTSWNKFIMWCKETSKTKKKEKFVWIKDYYFLVIVDKTKKKDNPSIVLETLFKNIPWYMIFVWLGRAVMNILSVPSQKMYPKNKNIKGIFFLYYYNSYTRIFLIQIIFVIIKRKRRYYHY